MSPFETTALLIRHAHTDAIGQHLAGRMPGVHLSDRGRAQAARLGDALASLPLAAVYTSPLDRTLETARAIARQRPVPIHEHAGLLEIDFGEWTGKSFAELEPLPGWRAFNERRGVTAIPGGERASDVQQRMVSTLETLVDAHRGETIAIVSHGDVIRYAVLHYAGAALDRYSRFEIGPASVTALAFTDNGPQFRYINKTL